MIGRNDVQITDTRFGRGTPLNVHFFRYAKGDAIAIHLTCATTGHPWGNATVNLPGQIPPGHVAVKNYAEGEGMDRLLIAAGVITPGPRSFVTTGFVRVPIHQLTEDALALASGK